MGVLLYRWKQGTIELLIQMPFKGPRAEIGVRHGGDAQ